MGVRTVGNSLLFVNLVGVVWSYSKTTPGGFVYAPTADGSDSGSGGYTYGTPAGLNFSVDGNFSSDYDVGGANTDLFIDYHIIVTDLNNPTNVTHHYITSGPTITYPDGIKSYYGTIFSTATGVVGKWDIQVIYKITLKASATPLADPTITYNHVGTGSFTANPTTGSSLAFGSAVSYTLTPVGTTIIDSVVETGGTLDVGSGIRYATSNIIVTVTTHEPPPATAKLSGSITSVATPSCLVTPSWAFKGGAASSTQGPNLSLVADGSVSGTSGDITVGDSVYVSASANDSKFGRLVSLVVDGQDYVANPTGGIATMVSTVPNGPYGAVFFTMPARDVSWAATFATDAFCFPGTGPGKAKPTPPGGSLSPQLPPGWTDPNPPTVGSPPGTTGDGPGDGPGDGGGGGGGGSGYPGPVGPGGTGGGPGGTIPSDTGSGNPRTVGSMFPLGGDWLGAGEPRGLVIRWRDNGKSNWSKEHVVNLGLQGETKITRELQAMGKYRTRQYEIVLVDRIPTGIFAVEERLVPSSDLMKSKGDFKV